MFQKFTGQGSLTLAHPIARQSLPSVDDAMPSNRAADEGELAEHVRKAVSPVETAPKQKHVRSMAEHNLSRLSMRRLHPLCQ